MSKSVDLIAIGDVQGAYTLLTTPYRIEYGKEIVVPNCQFRLETSTTIITNSLIIEERAIVEYGVVGIQTEATGTGEIIRTKILEIGDWDMVATTQVIIAHGLTKSKIRALSALIRDDADGATYNLTGSPLSDNGMGQLLVNSTNVQLIRTTSGFFDGVSFDLTPFNRGWIMITFAL